MFHVFAKDQQQLPFAPVTTNHWYRVNVSNGITLAEDEALVCEGLRTATVRIYHSDCDFCGNGRFRFESDLQFDKFPGIFFLGSRLQNVRLLSDLIASSR